jgi:hypothetical protein
MFFYSLGHILFIYFTYVFIFLEDYLGNLLEQISLLYIFQ